MKTLMSMLALTTILFSCSTLLRLNTTDYSYKYVELPSKQIKIGHSNELFEPCDTTTEFPSGRKFVVIAIRLRGDTTWIYCPKYK